MTAKNIVMFAEVTKNYANIFLEILNTKPVQLSSVSCWFELELKSHPRNIVNIYIEAKKWKSFKQVRTYTYAS